MAKSIVVVLDTNVFISGLISVKGAPGALLLRFRQGAYEIVTSKAQIKEIQDVLKRPTLKRALPVGTAKEVLKFFLSFKKLTKIIDPPKLPWEFTDVNDHFLLDLAVYSKASFLVTGDKKLLSLTLVGQCAVVSPTEFLGRL